MDNAGEPKDVSENASKNASKDQQLLHLVFGGELKDVRGITFRDLASVDIVGLYPSFEEAKRAWRGKAQETVDNAHTRYFIVHLHRLLDPETNLAHEQM